MRIREGLVEIDVPENYTKKGPGIRSAGFYNVEQVLNRDITVSLLSVLRPRRYLDGFGGTGIRAIRVKKELGIDATACDINPVSAGIIKNNAEINGADITVIREPFQSVVSRNLFDFIDVDPYGSVVPYLDAALFSVKNRGYIAATATDLSVLTGSVAEKTRRRYNAFIGNNSHRHEIGIRLLIADIVRRAAALDRSAIPVASFWHGHYYRVVFRVENGSDRADAALGRIGTFNRNKLFCSRYENLDEGPVWTGNLGSGSIIREAVNARPDHVAARSLDFLLSLMFEDIAPLFFEITDMARFLGKSIPAMENIILSLTDRTGEKAARTHFSSTGIKFGGTWEQVEETFNLLSVP